MDKLIAKVSLFLLILVHAVRCIDPIQFPLKDDTDTIVIYGQINDLDESHYVTINKISQGFKAQSPVSGATVELSDEVGTAFPYVEIEEGKYQLTGLAKGEIGRAYSIEVRIGEKIYKSKTERIPQAVGKDSTFYEISKEVFISQNGSSLVHHLSTYTKADIPADAGAIFLRWDVEEIFYWELTDFPDPFNTPPPDCFVHGKPDPQRIVLLDASRLNGKAHETLLSVRDIDAAFKNRHYILVRQISLTEQAYRYWSAVKVLIENKGSVFDIPPAPVVGNLYNIENPEEQIFGYFEATRTSASRFFLIPGWIPYYLEPYCEFDPFRNFGSYPEECLRCSELNSIPRPEWF